jgi:hypothetical protein
MALRGLIIAGTQNINRMIGGLVLNPFVPRRASARGPEKAAEESFRHPRAGGCIVITKGTLFRPVMPDPDPASIGLTP